MKETTIMDEKVNTIAAVQPPTAQEVKPESRPEPQRVNVPVWREHDAREVLNPVPGRRYHWLSDEDVRKGNMKGWNIDHGPNDPMKVKSANPHSKVMTHNSVTEGGTEVRAGTMVLGWMPEEDALARQKYFVDKGNAPLRDIQDVKQAAEAMQEKLREQGIPPDLIRVSGGLSMNRR